MLLKMCKYDKKEAEFLVEGFKNGFFIGHNEPLSNIEVKTKCTDSSADAVLQEKIEKEIELGRVSGPYDTPPFENYHISLKGKKCKGNFPYDFGPKLSQEQ